MSGKLDIKFTGILESRLPAKEIDFIFSKLAPLLPRIRPLHLTARLESITSIFSEQSYGCEEAILSGKALRWPSEIRNQRYCGEQAFVNFALTRALGLPSILVTTQDFRSRGMNHDVVLVPQREGYLMLDWNNISQVKADGNRLLDAKSGKSLSEQAFSLNDENIFDRIEIARRKTILEALGSLELLKREITPDGEVEALYGHNPNEKELFFEYVSANSSTPLSFYYLQRLSQNGSLRASEEAGIINKKQGYNYSRIPLLSIPNSFSPSIRNHIPDKDKLDEAVRKEIYLSVLYDWEREEEPESFVFSFQEREEFLQKLKEKAQDNASRENRSFAGRQIEFYHGLARTHSDESAQRYIDSLAFKAGFLADHNHDFYSAFSALTGLSSFKSVSAAFVVKGLERIQKDYFEDRDESSSAERVLFQQFTGRNYKLPRRELIARL